MKILFKNLSAAYLNGKLTDKEISVKFERIINSAFYNNIVIWHASKKTVLSDDFFDSNINLTNMTINWGGYGSGISKEKLFEYFNFQYPGDEVIDGKLKSKVTIRKNPFMLANIYFTDDVDEAVKHTFEKLGGVIEKAVSSFTLAIVSKSIDLNKLKALCLDENQAEAIQYITQEELQALFPAKVEAKPKTTTPREKKESSLSKIYTPEVYQNSLINDKAKFDKLKKLLTADSFEMIDSGLLLLSSMSDPVLFDALIEEVELVSLDYYTEIIPNKLFTGTKKLQPFYNYAITGILKYASNASIECTKIKSNIKILKIDLPKLTYLDGFANLEKLILVDSSQTLINLDEISDLSNLTSLKLDNCPAITSIDGIKNLPICDFDFGLSNKINSFLAFQGKKDTTNKEKIDLTGFDQLKNLDGIEFYHATKTILFYNCDSLLNAAALDRLTGLTSIIHNQNANSIYLYKLETIKGIILKNFEEITINIKNFGELSEGEFTKMKYLSISCSGMTNLDWLDKFPNLIGLDVDCDDLMDVSGINKCKNLAGFIVSSESIKDLSPIAQATQLIALNFNGCNAVNSIDFIKNLPKLKICGNSFRDVAQGYNVYDNPKQSLELLSTGVECPSNEIELKDLISLKDISSLIQLAYFAKKTTKIILHNVGLNRFDYLRNFTKLVSINISKGYVNDHLIAELIGLSEFQLLEISSPIELKINGSDNISFNLDINDAQNIAINNAHFKSINFNKLAHQDLTFLNSVTVDDLKITKSDSLISLNGLNANTIKRLDISELPNLKSIEGISSLKMLKGLSLKKIPKLINVADITLMHWLDEFYTEDCDYVDVKPKPKGQMTKKELLNYQLKLADFYKIANTESLKTQLATKEVVKEMSISPKELSKIKKLLQTRDIDMISSAVNMVEAINEDALCDALLEGITYDGKTIVPNKIFTGTGPAQPYLNTAMLGVLCVAVKFEKWLKFVQQISEIEIESFVLEYYNAFKASNSICVRNVIRVNLPLNLPNLVSFKWEEYNSYDLPKLTVPFSLSVFSGCINVESLIIQVPIKLSDDLSGLNSLTKLTELSLLKIQENTILSLSPLAKCNQLIKLTLHFKINYDSKMSSLNGLERMESLKYLSIIGTEIDDTLALQDLSNLEYIKIISDKLIRFTPPKNASKLSNLIFYDSNSSEYNSTCKNLIAIGDSNYSPIIYELNLTSTAITEFPLFNNTKSIEKVVLSSTSITSFLNFKNIASIKDFYLKNCPKIVDFKGFENVKSIEGVYINKCISLKSFKGLQNTKISSKVLDLDGCTALESLEDLQLSECDRIRLDTEKLPIPNANLILNELKLPKIKSLKGLGLYKNLKFLNLNNGYYSANHELEDYTHLSELTTLKMISILTQKALSLNVFASFTHLAALNLVGCKNLKDPEGLNKLAIDKLYIADCNLKKGDFPEHLQNNIDWQSKP